MVILKIGAGTDRERAIEIVDENGTWKSGKYHIFTAAFPDDKSNIPPEPHDINSSDFLGEMSIDKEDGTWIYTGDKLDEDEQQQTAMFIIDYRAPDGVY